MGVPNIQQQLYLKTALNESKDGMFDHPADLDEGYHKKKRNDALKAKGIAEALEEKLDEGYQAKRMRVLRKDKPLSSEVSDFMKRSFKKKRARQERLSGSKSAVKAMEVSARKKTATMKEKGLAEGSLGLKSVLRKGKHDVSKYGKHMTKNAVRELVARGRDPQGIKIYGTKGIENFGFQVNAKVKREKALKAKGIPNTPESLASRVKKATKRVNRMSR